jgi:hypothetical protein
MSKRDFFFIQSLVPWDTVLLDLDGMKPLDKFIASFLLSVRILSEWVDLLIGLCRIQFALNQNPG